MARNCYTIRVGGNEYKLRLTLKGQKKLKERNPGVSVIAAIMGAVDDPEDMDALLTEALNWEGNNNKIHSGEALYDELVDNGYCGSEAFLDIVLNIAKNAGLITEDERVKMDRVTRKMIRNGMAALDEELQDADDEEGEESQENPLEGLRTLDS